MLCWRAISFPEAGLVWNRTESPLGQCDSPAVTFTCQSQRFPDEDIKNASLNHICHFLWFECIPSTIQVLKQCDRWLGHHGFSFMNGNKDLIEEAPPSIWPSCLSILCKDSVFLPSRQWSNKKLSWRQREALIKTWTCWHPDLGLSVSKPEKIICYV